MKRIIILVLVFGFFIACVPTPEQEIVVNKGDAVADEKILSIDHPSERPEHDARDLHIPSHWTADASTEGVIVKIDAEVTASEGPYTVDRVENRVITNEDVNRILDEMYPNMIGYAPIDPKGSAVSKEIWTRCIETSIRGYAHREPDGSITYLPWDAQQATITNAEDNYRKAQFRADRFIDAASLPIDVNFSNGVTILLDDGREILIRKHMSELSIYEGETWTYPEHWMPYEACDMDHPIDIVPTITPEAAKDTAVAFMKKVGLGDLTLANIEKAAKESWYENAYVSFGYKVEFNRSGGYPACSLWDAYTTYTMQFDSDDPEYNTPIGFPETCIVYVTEDGIDSIEWTNAQIICEHVNPDVALLPFDEIAEIAIRYCKIGHAYETKEILSGHYLPDLGFSVDRMILTVMPQRLKDRSDIVLMPVWVLVMTPHHMKSDGTFDESRPHERSENSVLVINAIDGTRVQLPRDN